MYAPAAFRNICTRTQFSGLSLGCFRGSGGTSRIYPLSRRRRSLELSTVPLLLAFFPCTSFCVIDLQYSNLVKDRMAAVENKIRKVELDEETGLVVETNTDIPLSGDGGDEST